MLLFILHYTQCAAPRLIRLVGVSNPRRGKGPEVQQKVGPGREEGPGEGGATQAHTSIPQHS